MILRVLSSLPKLPVIVFLLAAIGLAGCSSSTSSTASYGGPSVSSVTAKRADARSDVREAKKALRAASREVSKLERAMARAERRLKRKRTSKTQAKDLKKQLRADKRSLRTAKRAERRAERKLSRAEREERRAKNAIVAAKKRQADAERKLAADKRRKADAERARRKKEDQERAQAHFARADSTATSGSLVGGLFSLSDPALKNVNDYQARTDNAFPVAAIPVEQINKRLLRQEVRYASREKPGTIIVDPGSKYLYLVQRGGKAMRYGIGVGKAGFEWNGKAHIGWKQKWPKWTPPNEMIERRPDLAKWSADNGGMPGGPTNPLGARALYLMQGNVDTLYRLHGTPNWASIGTAASSGCIRLMNQDIIDLYERVPNGAKVIVL